MNGFLLDVRFALRGFRRSPGFAAVAIATLAIGIGANTAIFSIVDGVLLRPFPHPDAGRIVFVREDMPDKGMPGMTASPPNYLDGRRQSRSFRDLAAYARNSDPVTGSGCRPARRPRPGPAVLFHRSDRRAEAGVSEA